MARLHIWQCIAWRCVSVNVYLKIVKINHLQSACDRTSWTPGPSSSSQYVTNSNFWHMQPMLRQLDSSVLQNYYCQLQHLPMSPWLIGNWCWSNWIVSWESFSGSLTVFPTYPSEVCISWAQWIWLAECPKKSLSWGQHVFDRPGIWQTWHPLQWINIQSSDVRRSTRYLHCTEQVKLLGSWRVLSASTQISLKRSHY